MKLMMKVNSSVLPIEPLLPQIAAALGEAGRAVLTAAPGAGKTTRVPLALLEEPWLDGRKILMLEPRRLAAKSVARYMARSLGEQPGETVGYRIRHESRTSRKTRLEVVTEGILIRMLQSDPALEEAGLVIFDEFHERSLFADLGLALCLQSRELLRPDLRLLVMSATLDAEAVAALLGGAPVIASEGRMFPVETRYLGRDRRQPIEAAAADAVRRALSEERGDLLVFLPGAPEIRKTRALLAERGIGGSEGADKPIAVLPLYGSLPAEEQERAIAPARPGERKVVLATSIAETSLTVEGVRVVIDCGLSRRTRFSPRTGMNRLETGPVSLDAAEQRKGRAGRVEPGVCYRLWTQQEEAFLPRSRPPEIGEADLAGLALELAIWGIRDPAELAWLDPPPPAAYRQAVSLLRQLGAVDESGRATSHGKRLAELGIHPRLAHMIVIAERHGWGDLACELAALLQERDVAGSAGGFGNAGVAGGAGPDPDIAARVLALRSGRGPYRAIREEARRLRRSLGLRHDARNEAENDGENGREKDARDDVERCGMLLAWAFPDRIGARRPGGGYLLANGRGAVFAREVPLSFSPYIVAVELDDRGTDSRILLAARIEAELLERHFSSWIVTESHLYWDRAAKSVRARRRIRIGAVTLRELPDEQPPDEEMTRALLNGIRQEGLELLPWTKSSRQLVERLRFLHHHDAAWPDFSDEVLLDELENWLAPFVQGMKSAQDLRAVNLAEALKFRIPPDRRFELDSAAPTHILLPRGVRAAIDYRDPERPVLAAKLQHLFGLRETPRIAGGKVPLTVHLLSPAMRPVQVTQDLAGFWRSTYAQVRKDLRGRYPKHEWPDDPLSPEATASIRPGRKPS